MCIVIENKSPAVSPKVVAQIFIIQNAVVISGSFLIIVVVVLDIKNNGVSIASKNWHNRTLASIKEDLNIQFNGEV